MALLAVTVLAAAVFAGIGRNASGEMAEGRPAEEESTAALEETPEKETAPETEGQELPREDSSEEGTAEEMTEETTEGAVPAKEPEEPQPEEPVSNGLTVVIDPGHQRKGDSDKEPNGPDSSVMKARVTGGTCGCDTGVMEFELNLDISLQLREELEERGYTVYMTRETHEVNISNMERAQYATSVGADIAVRIHANGAENSSVSGALALAPSPSNPYVGSLSPDSQTLGKCILDAYCEATGMSNQGVIPSDDMTGINWSTVPVMILEMGYMTNPQDDANMQDKKYQKKMVRGIADGIDEYFRGQAAAD